MNHSVFIISEVGVNANGDINIAKKLIKKAVEAGANTIKFQKRTISKVYTKEFLDSPRQSPWGLNQRAQKEGLEFNEREYDEIDRCCKRFNLPWFASAWDLESLEFLKKYKLPYNKIASPMLTHTELIDAIVKEKRHTFISTGMSTLDEVTKVVIKFRVANCPFEIMHCNSTYPCPDKDLNLSVISYLRKLYLCNVGYSGHSPGIMDGIMAAVLGASSVEKHITLSRVMYGSDQPSSLEIHGLAKMIEYIRYVETALGDGRKIVTEMEEKVKKKLRRNCDVKLS